MMNLFFYNQVFVVGGSSYNKLYERFDQRSRRNNAADVHPLYPIRSKQVHYEYTTLQNEQIHCVRDKNKR